MSNEMTAWIKCRVLCHFLFLVISVISVAWLWIS